MCSAAGQPREPTPSEPLVFYIAPQPQPLLINGRDDLLGAPVPMAALSLQWVSPVPAWPRLGDAAVFIARGSAGCPGTGGSAALSRSGVVITHCV